MRDIVPSDYISGGYYLTRLGKRAEHMSPDLVPEGILSASGICECFPDTWAIEWASDDDQERTRRAAAFGISPDELPHVISWATGSLFREFGWPSAFYDLDAARKAREKFLPDACDVIVIGLGLHSSYTNEFLDAARPSPPNPG